MKQPTNMIIPLSSLKKCSGKRVCLDTETTGLQWYKDNMIGLGVYCPDAKVWGYIPAQTDRERTDLSQAVIDQLDPGTTVIAHNAKFDLHFLGINPNDTGWNVIDTAVLIHLMDSRFMKKAEIAERQWLGTETKKELINRQPPKLKHKIWQWSIPEVAEYCMNDVRIEYEMAEVLVPLVAYEGLWDLFLKDMSYLALIWEVERWGIMLDVDFVNKAAKVIRAQEDYLIDQLYDGVGYKFNWQSHKQLSQALYEDMGIPRPENPFTLSRFNKDRGKYNSSLTSTFILMEKAHHPLGELVSTLRETKKLREYVEKWLGLMDEGEILHTDFNLTGTRTGRLSSKEPNLQNAPSEFRNRFTQAVFSGSIERLEEYNLRNGLIARPGNVFVSVDYKQMEMRMFGILSEDPFMLKSLAEGRDVHADIAEKVWGTRDAVHREWAKTISFGLIYGMTTGSLQFKLNLTQAKAQEITDAYWKTFPRIRPWLYGTAGECKENGFVTYWSGRRWVEDKEMFYFKAANALIQGGCADVLSVAALRVDEWGKANVPDWHIVNLVHDEIIAEVSKKYAKKVAKNMASIMQVPDLFDIPWFTDAKMGTTYGNLQKMELT